MGNKREEIERTGEKKKREVTGLSTVFGGKEGERSDVLGKREAGSIGREEFRTQFP